MYASLFLAGFYRWGPFRNCLKLGTAFVFSLLMFPGSCMPCKPVGGQLGLCTPRPSGNFCRIRDGWVVGVFSSSRLWRVCSEVSAAPKRPSVEEVSVSLVFFRALFRRSELPLHKGTQSPQETVYPAFATCCRKYGFVAHCL